MENPPFVDDVPSYKPEFIEDFPCFPVVFLWVFLWFSTFFAANRGPPFSGRLDSHGRLDITKEPIHHLHFSLDGMRGNSQK